MKRISLILLFFFLIYLTGAGGPLFAASPSRLVQEGNRLYRKGKYAEAIKRYDKAALALPQSPRISFNKGDAYFAKGDLEQARKLLRQAAQKAVGVKLESRAKYNLGNLTFQEAVKYEHTAPREALSKLKKSVQLYRETLDLDPTDKDAKYNIEVARLLMKKILDKLKKQKKKQKNRQKKTKKTKSSAKKKPAPSPSPAGGNKQKKEAGKKGKQPESQQVKKGGEKKKEELRKEQARIKNTQARDILREEKRNRELLRNLRRAAGGYQPVEKNW
jgi:Ca-activated chloride channel family protein